MRDQALAQLRAYLQHFPDEAAPLEALGAQLEQDPSDPLWRGNLRGHVTTSAFVLDATGRRLLMIRHRVIGRWLQPGGHCEGDAGLWQSACREVVEETGLEALSPHPAWGPELPLDIDTHAIAANPAKGEGAHWHHDYAYLMRAGAERPLQAQLAEVSAAAWVDLQSLAEEDGQGEPRWPRLLAKLAALGLKAG
ncbi:NUDIX hydrolase [Pelomonas sp. CA6]|uniref:NUDIX hydrolase n=1 Tax=Pelomonas sp. CA6 TaxID=2907999 RepID=UPI001F4BA436|nr:NUDIX hydrolase [Pelomonas sp. CA6]MCH7342802.1 NUDIX hydrolase [Pelomonas sp. CA6]